MSLSHRDGHASDLIFVPCAYVTVVALRFKWYSLYFIWGLANPAPLKLCHPCSTSPSLREVPRRDLGAQKRKQ